MKYLLIALALCGSLACLGCQDECVCPDVIVNSEPDSGWPADAIRIVYPHQGDTVSPVALLGEVQISLDVPASVVEWVDLRGGGVIQEFYNPADSGSVAFSIYFGGGMRYCYARVITTSQDTIATPQITFVVQ